MSHHLNSPLTAAVGAVVFGLIAQSASAVGVTVVNGNMNTALQATGGVLAEGQDVYVRNQTASTDGWRLWAGGGGGGAQQRLWNPSTTDRWSNGGNEWFDHSWGGNDGSGSATGGVIVVHTMTYDYGGGSTPVDSFGNRTWDTPDTHGAGLTYPAGTYNWLSLTGGVRNFEATAQQLDATFDPTAKYTLSVRVGRLKAGVLDTTPGSPTEGKYIDSGYNGGGYITKGADLTWGTGDDGTATTSRFANDAPALFNGYFVDMMAGGVTDQDSNYGGWVWGDTANSASPDYIGTIGTQAGDQNSIASDSWITSTISYVPNPTSQTAMNALGGKKVVVRLGANEMPNHLETAAVAFDDVVLTKIVAGDANEDDAVNFTDLNFLLGNYNGATTGKTWANGDFTGDGDVQFNDLNLLLSKYNQPVSLEAPLAFQASLEAGVTSEPSLLSAGQIQLVVNPDGSLQIEGDSASILSYQIKSASGILIPDANSPELGLLLYASNTPSEIAAFGLAPVAVNGLNNIDPAISALNVAIAAQDLTFFYGLPSGQTVSGEIVVIPEPASLAAIGLAGLLGLKRRRRAA